MGQDGILPSSEDALALLEGGSGNGGRCIHWGKEYKRESQGGPYTPGGKPNVKYRLAGYGVKFPLYLHSPPYGSIHFSSNFTDQFFFPTTMGNKRGTNIMGFFGRYALLLLST